MTNIERIFIEDSREKKRVAASASKKASRGKGRVSVRFPSDYIDGRTKEGRAYKGASPCHVYREIAATGELELIRIEK